MYMCIYVYNPYTIIYGLYTSIWFLCIHATTANTQQIKKKKKESNVTYLRTLKEVPSLAFTDNCTRTNIHTKTYIQTERIANGR